jgi:hypothetical protein
MAELQTKALRDYYPELGEDVSWRIMAAEQGDKDAQHELARMLGVGGSNPDPEFIDQWHLAAIKQGLMWDPPKSNRENLAVEFIELVDAVKAQYKPGEPFIYHRASSREESTTITGHIQNDTLEFSWRGPVFKPTGKKLTYSADLFPNFARSSEDGGYIELFRERERSDTAMQRLENIASGIGFLAFGLEKVAANVDAQTDEDRFYGALAVKLSGIDIGRVAISPEVQSRGKVELGKAMAYCVMGLDLRDVYRKYSTQHGSYAGFGGRLKSLQKLSAEEVRLMSDVLEFEPEQVVESIHQYLDELTSSDKGEMLHIAQAQVARQFVKPFVSQIFGVEV